MAASTMADPASFSVTVSAFSNSSYFDAQHEPYLSREFAEIVAKFVESLLRTPDLWRAKRALHSLATLAKPLRPLR